ncbi:hypothetical protein KY346_04915 [Candidatus Woesearchaeota archaeon]|nr:hypothetical protein [Candidatus Woesearchaeota archaeon]
MKRIIGYLYWHGWKSVTQISRDLDIPKSTVFDYMKEIEKQYSFVMIRKQPSI